VTIHDPTTETANKDMNMNRNLPNGDDSDSRAMITASEDSSQGDSGTSDFGGGSGSEPTDSERGGDGSGRSDNGDNSGGSGNGAQATNEKEQYTNKTDDFRKWRAMANRGSARESRERRKRLLSNLHRSVDKLTADNIELAQSNLALRQELEQILHECGLTLPSSLLSNLSIQTLLMDQGLLAGGGATSGDSASSAFSTSSP
jgi:hypothetical protein